MTPAAVAAVVIAVLVLLLIIRTVRVVPQAHAGVVERLGRYLRTQGPGRTLVLPLVDRMRPLIDLRERAVGFAQPSIRTADERAVAVVGAIRFQVVDARAATYEIADYLQALDQLNGVVLRNVIGTLALERALLSRDRISTDLRDVLDEVVGRWGIRVAGVEISAIDPAPPIDATSTIDKTVP